MKTQTILRGAIVFALGVGLAFIALNFLRLAFIVNIVHPMLVLNMLVPAVICMVGVRHWRRLRWTCLDTLMMACLLITGLTTNYAGRAMVDIGIDVLRPLLFMGTIITLRSLLDVQAIAASPTIRRLLAATVGVTLGAVVLCYILNATYHVLYPAYSTIDSILGLGWLMATANPSIQALYGLVLLASSKRGVYIVALLLFVLLYRKNRRFIISVVSVFILIAGILLGSSSDRRVDYSAFFVKSYIKQLKIVVDKKNFDVMDYVLDVVSGGRTQEMREAVAGVTSPAAYVFGEGYGFTYTSKIMTNAGESHRNLHFTPLSIIIYYGGVFFALLVWYLTRITRQAWRLLQDRSNPVLFTYSAYFIGSLLFCLSEYSLFVYANFAIACGIISASARPQQSILPAHESV